MNSDLNDGDVVTALHCSYTSTGGRKRVDQKTFEVWAENRSPNVIDTGRTIVWRAYGTGDLDKWPLEGTYLLPAALPTGGKTAIATDKVFGNISGCDVWVL